MAIEIVDPEPDKSVKKEVVCKSCGVRLSYLPIDVKERNGTDYSGGPDGAQWIDCPKCSRQVILKSW